MKHLWAVLLAGLILTGCKENNPVESTVSTDTQTESMFSETSMYNTTLAKTAAGTIVADSGRQTHDSLRNLRMLDSLKAYLSLTEDQFVLLQGIGTTLFTRLTEIRALVEDGIIARDSAKALVVIARDEFLASVRLILTEDQLVLFEEWITLYWNKPHHGGGRGGHGHHGGGRP